MKNKNRLHRNTGDGWIGGVCEGLGDYFDIDPTFIRLVFIFGSLIMGSALLAYLVLWIVVPDK